MLCCFIVKILDRVGWNLTCIPIYTDTGLLACFSPAGALAAHAAFAYFEHSYHSTAFGLLYGAF